MIEGARYVHTNLVARDWRALVDFYTRLFGCELVPPLRDDSGPLLEAGTGVPGAKMAGAHLRLPGHGERGPTLEIYAYTPHVEGGRAAANRLGYGHVAFEVGSVEEARREVLANGGRPVGEVVTLERPGGMRVTWCYVTDPEGNIVELQSWSSAP